MDELLEWSAINGPFVYDLEIRNYVKFYLWPNGSQMNLILCLSFLILAANNLSIEKYFTRKP